MRRALTIAGSDPTGGAGIQADLKTFHRFGVHGMSALSLIAVQSTRGLKRVELLDPGLVAEQIEAVVSDIGVDAVKTGALGSATLIMTVAEVLERLHVTDDAPLVVDPVMLSSHGERLLAREAVAALRDVLLPLATLITVTHHEAAALLGHPVDAPDATLAAAEALVALGPRAALIKGHPVQDHDEVTDVLHDGARLVRMSYPRVITDQTHGAGCAFSAAITAGLALGLGLDSAVERARDHIQRALETAPGLGHGLGPINHAAPPDP